MNPPEPTSPFPPMPAPVAASLAAIGVELDPGDAERLRAYLSALRAANERFNLTAITDPDQMWIRHVQDSLTLMPLLASAGARTAIDIGSGGGLPGIPLAIAMPDVRMSLLEATGKKAAFLSETIAALGLANAQVVHGRAEAAGQDHRTHRGAYDAVVARAVARVNVLAELTVPFAREGGSVFLVKGAQAAAEVAEAKQALYRLHAQVVDLLRTETGTIVVIEKVRPTPRDYPRLPGEPGRRPLA